MAAQSYRAHLAVAAVLVALAVLACRDAWLDIILIVRKDDEASHIMLVPPVFIWMTWALRDLSLIHI